MTRLDWELCADACPSERPCAGRRERYLAYWAAALADAPPSLAAKLAHAAAAVASAVGQAISGQPIFVRDETYESRLRVCESCPAGLYRDGACEHPTCGCKIAGAVRSKARLATEDCPMGFWRNTG